MRENKITLIGMPWAGKTTTAMALAQKLDYQFLDLDQEVEKIEGKNLIEVMNSKGAEYFRNLGFEFLQKLSPEDKVVVSPAGSVIYHDQSMEWIKNNSVAVFLDTPFEIIEQRSKLMAKAVADLQAKGLKPLWDQRRPMYLKHAQVVVNTEDRTIEQVVDDIVKACNL